jgi:hypothetical protein
MIDPQKLHAAVDEYYSNLPHPNAPSVKVKDYPAFAKVAMALKGAFPDGGDVENAHQQLKSLNLSPADFHATWDVARPLANRLLGRDPHKTEISRLSQASPGDIYNHYHDHPHPQMPDVRAGELVQYYHAAKDMAQQHQGRNPNHVELQKFVHGSYSADEMLSQYQAN